MSNHLIKHTATIKDGLQALNTLGLEALNLFVLDQNERLIGSITDGDIRRSLLKGNQITDSIIAAMNIRFEKLVEDNFSYRDIERLKNKNIRLVPIVTASGHFRKLIDLTKKRSLLPLDAMIMAGGEGHRLRPMTIDTPKPLLKIGGKPIIEYNIERLISFGIQNIHISLGYLGQQLVDYFGDGNSREINIQYTWEKEPLGTLGALRLLPANKRKVLLVMNSDILTTIDFEDFYRSFIEEEADFSIATIPYHVKVPYAVLQTTNNQVLALQEKPTYTYYSSAGIYLLKNELVGLIPDCKYDATDMIEQLLKNGKRVISYPIYGYWLDIGKPDDFKKAEEDIKHLKF
jgi:dTDP-glucose pyrophosphorylase